MYINNQLLNTTNGLATIQLVGSYGPVYAGVSELFLARSSGSSYSQIHLDEFILYKKVIDANLVNHIYNNGITGNPNISPYATNDMIAFYRMGDGAIFPAIPNEAPAYSLASQMINMDASDFVTDIPT